MDVRLAAHGDRELFSGVLDPLESHRVHTQSLVQAAWLSEGGHAMHGRQTRLRQDLGWWQIGTRGGGCRLEMQHLSLHAALHHCH